MEEHRGRTVAVRRLYPCSTQITPNKSDIGYHLSSVWSWGEKLKPTAYNVQCAKGHFTSHFVSFLPAILCLFTSLYQQVYRGFWSCPRFPPDISHFLQKLFLTTQSNMTYWKLIYQGGSWFVWTTKKVKQGNIQLLINPQSIRCGLQYQQTVTPAHWLEKENHKPWRLLVW